MKISKSLIRSTIPVFLLSTTMWAQAIPCTPNIAPATETIDVTWSGFPVAAPGGARISDVTIYSDGSATFSAAQVAAVASGGIIAGLTKSLSGSRWTITPGTGSNDTFFTSTTTNAVVSPPNDWAYSGSGIAPSVVETVVGTTGTASICSLSPGAGPAAGYNLVTISGSNFTNASAVRFGGTAATGVTVVSDTQITVTVPAHAAGTVDVIVTKPGGDSTASLPDQYTYVATPTVTSLGITSGPTAGGTTVVISGANFTGATAVKFGAANANGFTVDTNTQVTATSPAASAGMVDVTVVTAGGSSTTSAADQFSYVDRQTPAISTAAGGGTVSAQIVSGSTGCSFDAPSTASFTPPPFNGTTTNYGGLRFKLTGCNLGETVRVSVTWPSLSGMTAQKYGKTSTSAASSIYYTPANVVISGNTMTYDITDNGLGDDTFTGADGVINAPIVPVLSSALSGTNSVPTLGEWALMLLVGVLTSLGALQVRQRGVSA